MRQKLSDRIASINGNGRRQEPHGVHGHCVRCGDLKVFPSDWKPEDRLCDGCQGKDVLAEWRLAVDEVCKALRSEPPYNLIPDRYLTAGVDRLAEAMGLPDGGRVGVLLGASVKRAEGREKAAREPALELPERDENLEGRRR